MNCERFSRVLVVGILLSTAAQAQKVGTTSMQFLHVMPTARAAAMGDAYSTLATGADAVFWNPSGVALVEGHDLSSTYINWIFDTQQGALSYATSFGAFGAVGLQVQYVDFGTFEETTNDAPYIKDPERPGLTGRTFRPFSYLVGLTYAKSLTERFSTGITVKYARESLFNGQVIRAQVRQGVFEDVRTWGEGLLFDVGVRYTTGYRSVQIGASVQNFGADIKYAKEASAAPLLFRFGISGNIIGPEALLLQEEDNRFTVAFDLFQPNDYTQQAHLGVEYEYAGIFALRGGYKFNYDSEGLTLGVGFKHSVAGAIIKLDYSYGSMGTYLGNAQRISLGAQL